MNAEALALMVDAEVLAHIGGPIGDAARDRQREIATLDENASRAKRASWLAAARVPISPGLRGIDASWIEHAITRASDPELANERANDARSTVNALAKHGRRVIADGPTTAADVWLARWICAALPSMPPVEPITRPRSSFDAVKMSAAALRTWLEEVGADQIAFAVGKAATAMESRLGAAAVRIAQAPRAGEMGERRSAIERARIAMGEGALLRVGARTIAPYASDIERLQIAHRLPRGAGVLAEMEAFAGSAGAPSWRALAAM